MTSLPDSPPPKWRNGIFPKQVSPSSTEEASQSQEKSIKSEQKTSSWLARMWCEIKEKDDGSVEVTLYRKALTGRIINLFQRIRSKEQTDFDSVAAKMSIQPNGAVIVEKSDPLRGRITFSKSKEVEDLYLLNAENITFSITKPKESQARKEALNALQDKSRQLESAVRTVRTLSSRVDKDDKSPLAQKLERTEQHIVSRKETLFLSRSAVNVELMETQIREDFETIDQMKASLEKIQNKEERIRQLEDGLQASSKIYNEEEVSIIHKIVSELDKLKKEKLIQLKDKILAQDAFSRELAAIDAKLEKIEFAIESIEIKRRFRILLQKVEPKQSMLKEGLNDLSKENDRLLNNLLIDATTREENKITDQAAQIIKDLLDGHLNTIIETEAFLQSISREKS